MQKNVCIFHNGNSRIVELYKQKFSNLKFHGNWINANADSPAGLWEICFADATFDVLMQARSAGVFIIRHITQYQDDLDHLMPECEKFEYNNWLAHAVTNYLCFADQIVSEFLITPPEHKSDTVIVTTGRTANTHLQQVYNMHGYYAFENLKTINKDFLTAGNSVLLWREDQWQCLTSHWIATCTKFQKAHQFLGKDPPKFDLVESLNHHWIECDWVNMCQATLDMALLFKYVCNRPTSYTTTSEITKKFVSTHVPLSYNKHQIIPNYDEMQQWYIQSGIVELLDILYNNVTKHLTPWKEPWAQTAKNIKPTLI